MDKRALFQAVREHHQARLAELERSRDDATSGTRIDGDRPANRGERAAVSSQGYLAHGLGQRIQVVRDALELLDRVPDDPRERVAMGALVTVSDEADGVRRLLLLPGGEGLNLPSAHGPITVVSPDAPLVRPLLGREAGDEVVVRFGDRRVEVVIEAVD